MKPDKLTVHDLFQRERRYVVPLYQRPYVWGLEEQWAPLWEDIERQADACLAAHGGVSQRSHFLGAVVLNVSRIVGSGVARSEVIDGQQRLTTLQILLAALRDRAETMGSQYAARLRRLTEHEDEKAGSEGVFKVWPTNADRAVFRAVMTAGSAPALLTKLQVQRANAPRMAAAYFFFWDRIGEFLAAGESEAEGQEGRVDALRQALRTALQLVVIELEDQDDPQVIFETLNARGQPLLPSDLIRNFLFLQADRESGADQDALYDEYWRDFDDRRLAMAVQGENRFWHIDERQGRLTRPRIDLFLFHYLVMKLGGDFNIGQLFREFRTWRANEADRVEPLLADIRAHAAIFAQLIAPEGVGRVATFARRLKALDNSTVYPLLLLLLSMPSGRLSEASRDQIMQDLESWLVRRHVCWLTNKNYNRFFTALLTKVKGAAPDEDLAEVVRAELTRSADPTTAWPTDEEFLAAWLAKPVYAKSRPDRSVMLLSALELQLRTRRNEAVSLPASLSVEHLLPQKGALDDYPYADPMPRKDSESDDLCRERLIHTIGNLTLLTSELNASASNAAFTRKALKLVEDSDLRLNAWLRVSPPTAWSETEIVERGEKLFDTALEVWPRPLSAPENLYDDEPDEVAAPYRPNNPASMLVRRNQMVDALGAREGVTLVRESMAKYGDAQNRVRAVVAISKRYSDRGTWPYWYAHHPVWQAFIEGAEKGFYLLGCMDREECFALPSKLILDLTQYLNTTTRKDTGRMHWHLHLVERRGGLALLLPKSNDVFDVMPYHIVLPAPVLAEFLEPVAE